MNSKKYLSRAAPRDSSMALNLNLLSRLRFALRSGSRLGDPTKVPVSERELKVRMRRFELSPIGLFSKSVICRSVSRLPAKEDHQLRKVSKLASIVTGGLLVGDLLTGGSISKDKYEMIDATAFGAGDNWAEYRRHIEHL
jgi:hypothetical protein